MATTYTTPGVYIEEQPARGPISGVGTSTAAFIGVVSNPEVLPNEPILVTSWDDFLNKIDEEPKEGYYLWYAVRGFYQNGGKVAYVVRASKGKFDKYTLYDSRGRTTGGEPTLVVRAKRMGRFNIRVQATHQNRHRGKVFEFSVSFTEASLGSKRIQVSPSTSPSYTAAQVAAHFRIGDKVRITGASGAAPEFSTIQDVREDWLFIEDELSNDYPSGSHNIRIDDLTRGDKVLRLVEISGTGNPADLFVDSVIEISQTTSGGSPTTEAKVVKAISSEFIISGLTTYRVELTEGLEYDYSRAAREDILINERLFRLGVRENSGTAEETDDLSMAVGHPRYFATVLARMSPNLVTRLVTLHRPEISSIAPAIEKCPENMTSPASLTGGEDESMPPDSGDFTSAIDVVKTVDEVNFIAMPDGRGKVEQEHLLRVHCEGIKDRVAIFDPLLEFQDVKDQVENLRSPDGFAALYYPWLRVPHPKSGSQSLLVPPSGHIAGIYARSDATRGVHKAPANEIIRGAIGLEHLLNDSDIGELTTAGINAIRTFPNQTSPTVWGARTTAGPDATAWRYINVRRLMLYIEESIEESIRWAVFEPNNQALWKQLTRTIRNFLTGVWRDGALFGTTADEAFFVRCDRTTMTQEDIDNGRLIMIIGVAPVKPAEFIIIKIGQWEGGSEVQEL